MYALVLFLVVPVIVKIFAALGIGFLVFKNATDLLDGIRDYVDSNFQGVGSDIYDIFTILGVDSSMSIIFTAFTIKLTLESVNGAFKRLAWLADVGG